jgi:hypothetical protein
LLRFVGKAGARLGEQDSTTILGAEKVLRVLAAIDFVLLEGDRLESNRSGRSEVVVPERTAGRVLRGLCDLLEARSPGPALRRPTALALFLSVAQRLWNGPMRSSVLWRLQDCAWLATLPQTDAHEELWNSATEYLQPAAASRLGEALRLYELVATTKSALRDLAPAAGFDLALLRYRPTGWLLHRTFGLCEYELIEDDGDGSSETALSFVWSDAGDDEPDELADGRRVRKPVQLRMVGKHNLHLDAIARRDPVVGGLLRRLELA